MLFIDELTLPAAVIGPVEMLLLGLMLAAST